MGGQDKIARGGRVGKTGWSRVDLNVRAVAFVSPGWHAHTGWQVPFGAHINSPKWSSVDHNLGTSEPAGWLCKMVTGQRSLTS
eukprot:scaffold11157_cov17-Tisochrysis_lutea.AAC.1